MARDRFGFLVRHHLSSTSAHTARFMRDGIDCCLVAWALVSDLLLWAKHLFVRAMMAINAAEDHQDAKRN